MEQVVETMKQAQQTREMQYASDMSILRSELAYAKAQLGEYKTKFDSLQEEHNQTKLELSTALAASQIRVEQLQNLLNDEKYEL